MENQRKHYNPYMFPVRVINDLGEEQILVPLDRGRVKGDEYDGSKLELKPYAPNKRGVQIKEFGHLDLKRIVKKDLRDIAWAVCLNIDLFDRDITIKELIEAIEAKAMKWATFDGGPSTEKKPRVRTGEKEIQAWLQEKWVE